MNKILITDLRRSQCRFPISDHHAPSHFFCGEPVEAEGVVYCAKHAALCYDRRSDEVRRAARQRAALARSYKKAAINQVGARRDKLP